MNISSDICQMVDRNNIDLNSNENILDKSKIKLLDNRKIVANEKFEKIGNLPNQESVMNKEVHEMNGKIPVIDLIAGGYSGEMGFDYHRPCNCTKSYCLKLYCECFARDKLCVNCNCNNCMNNLSHEKSRSNALLRILDKNPLAFLPKIGSGQGQKLHRKGCNCKRSECLKNYCECREAKIECSLLCRCQGCKNRSNELSAHSSQAPCSLDMTGIEPDGFKSANISFKSGLVADKSEEDGVDINYPFRTSYEESNLNQTNAYCNGVNMPDYSGDISYPSTVNSMDNMVKYNEFYKNMNESFYKQIPPVCKTEDLVNNSNLNFPMVKSDTPFQTQQSHIMNWNPFMNVKNENIDYKQMPYNNLYPTMNFNKFSNSQNVSRQCSIPPAASSSDLDEQNHMIIPGNSMQFLNDPDEYLDLSSGNYYKPYNHMSAMKRYHDPNQYNYHMAMDSRQLDAHSTDNKGEKGDNTEVTSTNEMDASLMMVSSNCDSLSHHQTLADKCTIKPSSCDSHSPHILKDNYNCYPFQSESMFVDNSNSKPNFQMTYPSQNINGQVLPSLFNNVCETSEMTQHIPFYRQGTINQQSSMSNELNLSLAMQRRSNNSLENNKYPINCNYDGRNNSNFYNFYEPDGSSVAGNSVPLTDEDDMLRKSDSSIIGHHNVPMTTDHFNPFFYNCYSDAHPTVTNKTHH